ncbi:putative NAD(P)-binding domain, NAD(P)-binding domain superfamily [Helianthus annuus]|uniref:NAD(P)-binding domain, NAD(P)-binding domain superfamily n=1 Tax=Helianthus annuus TaxID=4232 RepID=A0A251TUV3_HELAN|nr:putative NAD(P)-binding domain, NAD(P)-binding domain superfamily [Helianthus annuus]
MLCMLHYKRKICQPKGALNMTTSSSKKILVMGGTRFIGIFLSRLLDEEGHQVTLFTRGKALVAQPLPGEADDAYNAFKSKVIGRAAEGFDVVYDINGREAEEVEPILDALPNLEQYIYCSSAGVYLKSDLLPHYAVDPQSRHKGKLETEALLESKGVNYTSIRPVYIYGPLNYNRVE